MLGSWKGRGGRSPESGLGIGLHQEDCLFLFRRRLFFKWWERLDIESEQRILSCALNISRSELSSPSSLDILHRLTESKIFKKSFRFGNICITLFQKSKKFFYSTHFSVFWVKEDYRKGPIYMAVLSGYLLKTTLSSLERTCI